MSVLEATPTALDRLERISSQAREVHVGVVLAAFVASVLMWVGRIPAYAVKAVVWSCCAVAEGYREVRPPAERDRQRVARGGGS